MTFKKTVIYQHLREALKKPLSSRPGLNFRDIKFFSRFLVPAWKLTALTLVLTIISSGLSSLLPLGSKGIIDFVIMKKDLDKLDNFLISYNLDQLIPCFRQFFESVNLVVLAVLLIGTIAGFMGIIQRYLTFRLQQELTFSIQTRLFDHLLRFPVSFFKKSQVGYLSSRVSDDVHSLRVLFHQGISQMIPKIFYLFFGIVIMYALNTRLALILLGVLPFYIFINLYFAPRLRAAAFNELESNSQVSKDIQEVLSGVETIKAYASEKKESRKVSGKMRSLVQTRTKSMLISLLSDYSTRALQFVSVLFVMLFGIKEITKGAMTIGDYVAFTSYAIFLSGSINSFSRLYIMLQPVFSSLERLYEIFRVVPEPGKEEEHKKPAKAGGEIFFNNVTFSYEEGQPVFKNITFMAHPGEIIALVGHSGSGKTTLVNLLLKFYRPDSGSIYMDGYDLNEINTSWLREQIGVVSQEVFLFNDTVGNNIKYSNPFANKDDIINAAKKAGIHHDIERFAYQYETVIGEKGIRLSAGQRQRISIARAFLKDSPVLILDEPASALDPETETVLKDSIKSLSADKTIFIIAHRLSTIEIADRILVLENGKFAESGTHFELLAKKGVYARIFEKQNQAVYNPFLQ